MSYQQQFGHVDREERLDQYEEPQYDEPPRRNFAGLALAGAAMAVFAGGLWLAYHLGTKQASAPDAAANVPLIRAAEEPVKVKPDKAGGMAAPDKDNPLYAHNAGGASVEHILPLPEQPQPRPAAPPPPQVQAAPAPPPPAVATPQPEPAPVSHRPAAAAAPKAAPKPTTSISPASAGGAARVQLASVRTPEAARVEWARLKRSQPDLLGRLSANAVRADLGERGIYYRVEAGPLADHGAAVRLCKALKGRGLGCTLVK